MPDQGNEGVLALIIESHRRIVGRPLVDERLDAAAQAAWLNDDAPFGLLAHDTQADPRFTYANLAALSCFEYPDDELIGLPSRLSAEAPDRAERQRLLEAVARDGFAEGYRGLRIAKSGLPAATDEGNRIAARESQVFLPTFADQRSTEDTRLACRRARFTGR